MTDRSPPLTPRLTLDEWRRLYVLLDSLRGSDAAPRGEEPTREWKRKTLAWCEYPPGTYARDHMGASWMKLESGCWKASGGDVFPTPSADALDVLVPARAPRSGAEAMSEDTREGLLRRKSALLQQQGEIDDKLRQVDAALEADLASWRAARSSTGRPAPEEGR